MWLQVATFVAGYEERWGTRAQEPSERVPACRPRGGTRARHRPGRSRGGTGTSRAGSRAGRAGGVARHREARTGDAWGARRRRRVSGFAATAASEADRGAAPRRRTRGAVRVYAESSAVLAWLLDEPSGSDVRAILTTSETVITSDLTVIESDRVLLRAALLGELTEAEAADRRAHLMTATAYWHVLRISPEIVERARQPFPGEPIRTVDAIHLASALVARGALPGLDLLSLDDRIRRAAAPLGLRVRPD